MKNYFLVENETHKQTPFRHFADIINVLNSGGLRSGMSNAEQASITLTHNRWNVDLYFNYKDNDIVINSFSNDSYEKKVDLKVIADRIKTGICENDWAGCGFILPEGKDRKELQYWYRDKTDHKIKDCYTGEVLNNGQTFISETLFLVHGSWGAAPLFHLIVNDDVLFNALHKIDNDKLFLDNLTYHWGTLRNYVMFPTFHKSFEQDGVVISPTGKFSVNFYERSALGNTDFDFSLFKLKIRTNLKFEKVANGVYEFDLEDKSTGYIYARIPASFGAEQDPATWLRLAYTVHKS